VKRRTLVATDQVSSRDALEPWLDRWVAGGVITSRQAELIRSFEAGTAQPATRRIAIVVEVLGYVGLALGATGITLAIAQSDVHVGTGGALVLLALATACLLTGFLTICSDDPAIERLASVLGFLAVVSLAGVVVVFVGRVLDAAPELVATAVGGACTIFAWWLWARQARVGQEVALLGSAITTLVGGTLWMTDDATAIGLPIIALGLAWLWLCASGRMRPVRSGQLLGALTALAGAEMLVGDSLTVGGLVGTGLAVALVVWGARRKQGMLVGTGAVGLLLFVPEGVRALSGNDDHNGTPVGVAVGLFAVGVLVLAIALGIARRGRQRDIENGSLRG